MVNLQGQNREIVIGIAIHCQIEDPPCQLFRGRTQARELTELRIFDHGPYAISAKDDDVISAGINRGDVGLNEEVQPETFVQNRALGVCPDFFRRKDLHPHQLSHASVIVGQQRRLMASEQIRPTVTHVSDVKRMSHQRDGRQRRPHHPHTQPLSGLVHSEIRHLDALLHPLLNGGSVCCVVRVKERLERQ